MKRRSDSDRRFSALDAAAMISFKTFKSFLAPTRVVSPTSKPISPDKDYRAVLVVPGARCCSAAMLSAGERYLLREAPRLPLAECTLTAECSCKFRKVSDRRDADRRRIGVWDANRWYGGPEHRSGRDRRASGP